MILTPLRCNGNASMTLNTLLRATLVWFLTAVMAIGNGLFRNEVLMPLLGQELALPASGITLAIIVLFVTYLAYPFLKADTAVARWLVGLQWVTMTLLFEFLFGHYVVGKSWAVLMRTFNILEGDLFLLVLLVTLTAPNLVMRYREKRLS